MDTHATQLRPGGTDVLGAASRFNAALPFLALLVAGISFPLFGGGYWGVIATRACVYWVLVSGLNLVVGFGVQIAIGWVALLTLGAYTTSVLVAGNVMPALPPYLALAIAAVLSSLPKSCSRAAATPRGPGSKPLSCSAAKIARKHRPRCSAARPDCCEDRERALASLVSANHRALSPNRPRSVR